MIYLPLFVCHFQLWVLASDLPKVVSLKVLVNHKPKNYQRFDF